MEAEGLPGEDLEEFFEGAEAAGKREEGVGLLSHESLAGVHGVDDVKLGDAAVGDFEIDEDLWDDAGDAATGGNGGVGDGLHKADVGAAVDEADIARGESVAELCRCGLIGGVDAE